jgi:hypothetical protein
MMKVLLGVLEWTPTPEEFNKFHNLQDFIKIWNKLSRKSTSSIIQILSNLRQPLVSVLQRFPCPLINLLIVYNI